MHLFYLKYFAVNFQSYNELLTREARFLARIWWSKWLNEAAIAAEKILQILYTFFDRPISGGYHKKGRRGRDVGDALNYLT
jgi:hypothetical protein